MIWIILACLLLFVCVCLFIRLMRLKAALRGIKKELVLTRERSYDRQLTIPLIDNDLSEMTAEINNNLSYQKQLKLEAERSEKSIRQSISDIAHDLRTPLTVIKGDLQLISPDKGLSEKSREYLRVCIERTDSLREMTDDFFELSVLESEDVPVELKKIDATAFFLGFIADSEAVITQAGLAPKVIFPEKSVFILADESMLLRMLGNLLNNVIKYAQGQFTAELSEKDGLCVISFTNKLFNGQITEPEKLFERTWRGDKARQAGGAGLGLYIVKLLANMQNAEVSADAYDDKLSLSIIFNAG